MPCLPQENIQKLWKCETHGVGIVVRRTQNSIDKRTAVVSPSVGQVHKLLKGKAGTIIHHLQVSVSFT